MDRADTTVELATQLKQTALDFGVLRDETAARLWSTLADVIELTRSLDLTASVVRLAAELCDVLELKPADGAVLASVIESREKCATFMSRDGDLAKPQIKRLLAEHGISFYADAEDFIRERLTL